MGSAERRSAMLVAGVVLVASRAAASDGAPCRAVTERRLSDVRVDLEVARSGKHEPAIDILEGEVLCARVRRTGSGGDLFEIVNEGNSEDTLRVELQRMTRRFGTREVELFLNVRAPSRHGILYRAAVSLGQSRDAREVFPSYVGPGSEETVGWPLSDRTRHHVLVFGMAVDPPPARPTRPLPNFIGISLVTSFHENALGNLDAEVARNGFGGVSNIQPYMGLAFDGGIGRFRATWDIEVGLHRAGEALSPTVYGFLLALHAGYAVYRGGGFALFPMLGIAGGDQRISVNPGHPAIFPAELRDLAAREDVRKNLGWLLLSIGTEYRWPLTDGSFSHGGLLLGARGGYAYQFAETNWLRDSASQPVLPFAPAVDTSGPYLRFGLGWYEE